MTNSSTYSIIVAEFNKELTDGMLAIAMQEAEDQGIEIGRVLRVPGCYEMPLIAELEMRNTRVRGLAVLGYIERGETLHGEVMGHVVHRALVELQIKTGKPIGLGIIGPGATKEQAAARQVRAAKSAIVTVKRLVDLIGRAG